MKSKFCFFLGIFLTLLLIVILGNWNYEVIAIHPFRNDGLHELKVMTWNVHCSSGTDGFRQKEIANLILKEDVDLALLNEYNQDSCLVTDSILRTRFPYTVEHYSHKNCGDIFYSKRNVNNSGFIFPHMQGKGLRPIKTTIAIGRDSIQIFGIHLDSHRYEESANENTLKDVKSSYERYKNGLEVRCFQARKIKDAVLKTNHPVIVMGDMNDFNCSSPIDIFASCGLRDSWWEGGNGYGCTYHNGWMLLRIDHILHSEQLELQSIKVIDTNLSDHNPVVAGFNISK